VKQERKGKGEEEQEVAIFLTNSCKCPTEEVMGAQKFNCPLNPNGKIFSPDWVVLDNNFPTNFFTVF